jgi:hypothetical protein
MSSCWTFTLTISTPKKRPKIRKRLDLTAHLLDKKIFFWATLKVMTLQVYDFT